MEQGQVGVDLKELEPRLIF